MADKYLKNNGASLKEVEAKVTSAGVGDAGKVVALDATGKLDQSLMPVGIGDDTKSMLASENLAAGDFVNIWSDATVFKIRKADATTEGKFADGFILSAILEDASGDVYFEGTNTQVSGMTPGDVFLSTTAGTCTATPPSGTGNVVQRLGSAISATEVNFERGVATVLA